MKYFAALFATLLIVGSVVAQKNDTIRIDRKHVSTSVLKPGVHQYLVYFRNGKDSSRVTFQFWTREVEFTDYEGRAAIRIKQVWEDNKSIVHTVNTYCDRKDLSTLYQESWLKDRSTVFDFINKTMKINDKPVTEADTARSRKGAYAAFKKSLDQYFLNWHLDLEVFPTLPYKDGVTFMINYYDPGFFAPSWQAYSVTGSGKLTGYGGQDIDCWLLYHESRFGKETFWISKKTKEVLKLEQTSVNGKLRYKVKLPFVAP